MPWQFAHVPANRSLPCETLSGVAFGCAECGGIGGGANWAAAGDARQIGPSPKISAIIRNERIAVI
jgi:hypothetical protein